jgi:23S rRNA (uracil1939-C5)-methyltransferase
VICPHAGDCGGCSLLHLSYAEQVASKETTLLRLLAGSMPGHLVPAAPDLFLPVASAGVDPTHFRQKVAFVFGRGSSGRGLVMGHYRRASQRVVPIVDCPAHNERGNTIAFALRDHLARCGISAAGPRLDGILRHLIVRTTADNREAVAMLVVTRNDKSLRRPVRALLDSAARPDGFFINVNARPGPFMMGDQTLRVDGRSHVRENVGGVSYLISPTAFFQTNVAAAAVLQDFVVRSTVGAGRVLDLYCGSGLFALPLALSGVQVTGVEENPQAIADAGANARLNGIAAGRLRFLASRVELAVRSLRREPWDAVILDPPRVGCSEAVLEAVFQDMAPPRVTYVSCNPESLAAELPGIVRCGYRIEELRAVDMFPHTDHLEVVVRLRRA